jgi:hypothetical protein
MGDGGPKDELAKAKKSIAAVLGYWYYPRGYTLVLDGDVEDLRGFWFKDILAAWPELYAVFDVYSQAGRLRKIAGERDLALLRIASYPYEMSHALRLDTEGSSLLILHGHQASTALAGRNYLSDYLAHWLATSKRPKVEAEVKGERFKTERRLYRAACSLGIILIQGHTRRPLFESLSSRDTVRAEVERLLREPQVRPTVLDRMIDLYREEVRADSGKLRFASSGASFDERGIGVPCLFSPGRALGRRGLRAIEIEGGKVRLVRWTKSRVKRGGEESPSAAPWPSAELELTPLAGSTYARYELRSTAIDEIVERVGLLASNKSDRDESPDGDN